MFTVKYVETKRTLLPQVQEYLEYDIIVKWTNNLGPQERKDHYKVPVHMFKEKIEGDRYVDGEFTTKYVQYL